MSIDQHNVKIAEVVVKTIAIALATYNGEKFLKKQLDSLINQTYQDFVCYVHDDGSTDATVEILNEYKLKYPDKFVILEYPPFHSFKKNFLSIIKYINEPYLMFCDQDDIWLKEKIQISYDRIKAIEKNNNCGILLYSNFKCIDGKDNVLMESYYDINYIHKNNSYNRILFCSIGSGCTMIMNKIVYKAGMKYNNIDNIYYHDYWMTLVASAIGIVDAIEIPTILYRLHANNAIGLKNVLSKKTLSNMRLQASELCYIPEISLEKRDIAYSYANIYKKNKIARLMFHVKNKIRRRKADIIAYILC